MDLALHGLPPLLAALANTSPMLRLREVGMHCGCEYTGFPRFQRMLPYSRYTHSLGVARIVWQFTHDPMQAAAGLLHDVATPTFAHVVDFLRGDYLTQEATEDGTRTIIEQSGEIQILLWEAGLMNEDVCDYHRYPIADNDAPRLSADRLEYTLGNLVSFGLGTPEEAQQLYADLCVGTNEENAPELAFRHPDTALRFAKIALHCARVYVSDEDRYSMQMLSELLRGAMAAGVLGEADLMGGEPALIEKLRREPFWAARWAAYCGLHALERSEDPRCEGCADPTAAGWRRIDAKRRCIDPLIDGHGRVSALFPDFAERLHAFRTEPFDSWLRAAD